MTATLVAKGRLLVADDDLVFQALFEAAAIEADYEVVCVCDGDAAIASALEYQPDLIFLDRYMPGKTGLEVCRELNESLGGECPPIVIVTGADGDADINSAFAAGALDYLVKPVNWLLFQYRVARWMEAGQLNQAPFDPRSDRAVEVVVSSKGNVLDVIREGKCDGLREAAPGSVSLADFLPKAAFEPAHALIRKALRTRESLLDRVELNIDTAVNVWDIHVTPIGPAKANLILEPHTRRHESHSNLFRMAYIDHLTGLPNQHLYTVKGKERLLRAEFEGRSMTVVCIAIDGIPRFDEARLSERQALAELATSMNNNLAENEHIVVLEVPHASSACMASFDGRYCLALFEHNLSEKDLKRMAKSLQGVMERYDNKGRLTARLGYARFPEDGTLLDVLMESAHYAARTAVRDRVDFHRGAIADDYPLIKASEDSEAEVYDALEKDQIEMHYQPRINFSAGHVDAAEALIRWRHPVFGTISASEIFRALAGAEAVRHLCDWAITEALENAKAWTDAGISMKVTVNLAHEQVVEDDFADRLLARIDKMELDPTIVELEVSESALDCSSLSLQQFEELSEAGVGLIIDNFGAGKVNLSGLRRLRINGFKVDRQLTRASVLDLKDSGIYSMAHAIAETCGAVLIAKNIESQEELEFAKSRLCDQGQGFHICQPLPVEDLQVYAQQLARSEASPLMIASTI